MPNNVVTLKPRRAKPRSLGPVPAIIESSMVLQGRASQSDVLDIRLNVRLDDIPKGQRRSLAALLHSTALLNLTLAERETPEGGGRRREIREGAESNGEGARSACRGRGIPT